jgi:glycosyltransferase involved in cell wall biosynthesis
MKKMNTAFLHYTAPPVVGGVEIVMQEHAQIFSKHGQSVTIIAGRGDAAASLPDSKFILVPEMDTQNALIQSINFQLEKGKVPQNFEQVLVGLYEKLTPYVEKFDHVIVHNVFTKHFNLPLTAALFRMLDEKIIQNCIAWCHDFTWTSPRSGSKVYPGYPWDLLRTYRADLKYVVVSKQRQQEFADMLGIHNEIAHVVYNGVNPDQLLGLSPEGSELIERLKLMEADLVLLMPVRVTQAKNIEFAMQTAAILKDNDIKLKLIITGPPDPHDSQSMSYFESLKKVSHSLSLDNVVHFIFESGPEVEVPYYINSQVVSDLFRASDIMFMPSHREGFGMPVLEAGLVGITVLSSNIPAAKEIGEGDILTFSSHDSPGNVAMLITNWIEKSINYRLRRRVKHKFTWESIFCNHIQPLLNKAYERNGCRSI